MDGHSFFLIAAEDLSQLGEEVDAFGVYMKELFLGETASFWKETPFSLSYYYQMIRSNHSDLPTQRFLYYGYLKTNHREYLLQMTSQSAPADEEKKAPPEGIDAFEDMLDGLLSCICEKNDP